jgi:DNA-directed RNA polymerase specialized sigma24 family protein
MSFKEQPEMTTPTKTEKPPTEDWIVENIYKVERIARKYADRLRHSDVEDLVQEALHKMIIVLRERGDKIYSGGYLLAVADRAMFCYIRDGGDDLLGRYYDKSFHGEWHDDVSLFSVPVSGGDGKRVLADILVDEPVQPKPELKYRWLNEALLRLTENGRQALAMRYGLAGCGRYNPSEAVKVLGVTAKAYERRVNHARSNLRNDEKLARAWKRAQAARLNKRHCLVCHKRLPKVQIAATGKTLIGETFLCKACNMTYELNGYGCAVKRTKEVIVSPAGGAELESVLQINRS